MIKESQQCPPAPQPLGIWKSLGGGVIPLIPRKLPQAAQSPGRRVLCLVRAGSEPREAGPTLPVPQVTLGCTPQPTALPGWTSQAGGGGGPQVPILPPITSLVTLGSCDSVFSSPK